MSRYSRESEKPRRRTGQTRERDGVIYEPGEYARTERKSYESGVRTAPLKPPPQRRKKKPQKSQFALFYIITLLIGVIVCLVIFAIVFNNITGNREAATPPPQSALLTPSPTPSEAAVNTMKELVGVITDIDFAGNELRMTDVETEKSYTVEVDSATTLKNKYGQEIVLAEFIVGDIVNATFNTKNNVLKSIAISAQAWELKLTKDVAVDTAQSMITVGNNHYFYDRDLIVTYQDRPADVADITPVDILTMRGYADKVRFIEVNKSHGYIEVINKDKVKDGTLEVDTAVFMPLSEADKLELQEGPHKIVVKGANIEPYTKDIVISAQQSEILDVTDIQYKSGVVTVKSNVGGYTLTIGGKEYPANEPLVLDLGTYALEATKEGYLPFKTTFDLTEPAMDVTIEMQEEVVMRKFTVNTVPEGAEVYIDNGLVGLSPASEMLTDGKHTVTVRKNGYHDTTITVEVSATAQMAYLITMQAVPPPTGTQTPAQDGAPFVETPLY